MIIIIINFLIIIIIDIILIIVVRVSLACPLACLVLLLFYIQDDAKIKARRYDKVLQKYLTFTQAGWCIDNFDGELIELEREEGMVSAGDLFLVFVIHALTLNWSLPLTMTSLHCHPPLALSPSHPLTVTAVSIFH